ncbi:MAG: hypothetical protein GQ574_13655 [Crocinitomix sp.]|nr:hypothetical protein [Crocinitomix sp.]
MNKSFLRNQVLRLSVFIIIIAAIHYLLLSSKLPPSYAEAQPWKIYVIMIPLTALGLLFIIKRYQKNNQSMVNSYMFYNVVKMLAALFFLFPWLIYKDVSSRPMIIQFFAVFFPILLFETIFLVKILSNYREADKK